MLQTVLKDEKLLHWIYKIKPLRYFFVPHICMLQDIKNQEILDFSQRMIYVSSGTSRQTKLDRFKDIDDLSISFIQQSLNPVVHDVAVSSGATSRMLYKRLVVSNKPFAFFISDKFAKVYVQKGFISRVFDADAKMMWGYVGRLVANQRLPFFYVSKLLFWLIRKDRENIDGLDSVWLYERPVVDLLRDGKINHLDYDIFNTHLSPQFTFVRAMNILNLNYFSQADIKKAIQLLGASLVEDGVLQVGRTSQNGESNVSFFRKCKGEFQLLETFRQGSEISFLF